MHIAKIKSVNLDKWAPEVVEMYKFFSNRIANFYYEATLPNNFQKPTPASTSTEVERFIRDKYIHKKWIHPKMNLDPVSMYK